MTRDTPHAEPVTSLALAGPRLNPGRRPADCRRGADAGSDGPCQRFVDLPRPPGEAVAGWRLRQSLFSEHR